MIKLEQMNDEQIGEIANKLEKTFMEVCKETNMTFIEMAAIALARLGAISNEIGEGDLFIKLLHFAERRMNDDSFDAASSNQVH